MPRNRTPVFELGTTYTRGAEFGAHIQFRDDGGNKTNIYGPSRGSQNEAQKDLDQIRAAGRVGATREEGLKLMEAEAKQIKMSAAYQAQIQEALHRMSSKDLPNESDYEDDDDASDHSEPPYLKEHLVDDSSEEAETSQKKQEHSTPTDATTKLPEEAEKSQKEQEHLTPIEATAKLSKFRPVISKPSELKYLLESKADPNMPVEAGNITPLRNIMSFAPTNYVVRMRDLLLEYGAKESEEEKKRWVLRQLADKAERIRMNDERDIINERVYTQWLMGDGM